jgi:uncharacterized membrane protein
MKRWIGPLLVLALTALAAHGLALSLGPGVIMDRAMAALEARGVKLHAFTTPERVTPQTQQVVRSSPDLYYALCRYDLPPEGAQLAVNMAEWPGYQSLSFFDARTNNFATLRAAGQARKVRLFAPGALDEGKAGQQGDELWIESPSARGVVLIRRLAPTQDLFEAASTVGQADACALARR